MFELIFSVLVFCAYLFWVVNKYGMATSMSATYYNLPINRQFLFTLFCWFYASPILLICEFPLIIIAVSGVAIVGAAAAFRGDELINRLHMISASVAAACTYLSLIFDFHQYWIAGIAMVVSGGCYLLQKKFVNGVFWAEVTCYVSLILTLFLSLLK